MDIEKAKNICKELKLFNEKTINTMISIINKCEQCDLYCGKLVKLNDCICKNNILCFNCLDNYYDNYQKNKKSDKKDILFICIKCKQKIKDYDIL